MGSTCSVNQRNAVVPSDAPSSNPGSPWILWEDDHGNAYYYNFRTGVYSHEEQQCDWYQYYDENGSVYWSNDATGETSWNGPCTPPELPMLFEAMQQMLDRHQMLNGRPQAQPVDGVPVAQATEASEDPEQPSVMAMAVPMAEIGPYETNVEHLRTASV